MNPAVPLKDVLAEHHQVFILSISIADIPDYAHVMRTYQHAHGDIAAQTFAGLKTELLIASRNMTMTSTAHLGLTAIAPVAAPAALGAAAGAPDTAAGDRPSTGCNTRRAPAAAAAGAANPSADSVPTYQHCWYHGDCGHFGASCNKKDTPGFDINATKANPGIGGVAPWSQVRLTKN
jgi:hypothetical protein